MSQKEINPLLKLALDFGPVLLYLLAYKRFQESPPVVGGVEYGAVVAATAVFVPLMLVGMAITFALTRSLPRMAVFTALMVVVFGVITVWLNDDTFTKMRPTLIYSLLGLTLAFGLFIQKRSYLQYLMGQVMEMSEAGWRVFTRNWVIFFGFMAVFNEFVWRVLGEEAWIWLDTVGQMALTFLFLATQYPLLMREMKQAEAEKGE